MAARTAGIDRNEKVASLSPYALLVTFAEVQVVISYCINRTYVSEESLNEQEKENTMQIQIQIKPI